MENSLISICGIAFGSVFFLLAFLAIVMRMLIAIFPYDETEEVKKPVQPVYTAPSDAVDSSMIAAITTVMAAAYPGNSVTKIEEIK